VKTNQKKAMGKAANTFPTFIVIIPLWNEAVKPLV
jgi:hypothetical protein